MANRRLDWARFALSFFSRQLAPVGVHHLPGTALCSLSTTSYWPATQCRDCHHILIQKKVKTYRDERWNDQWEAIRKWQNRIPSQVFWLQSRFFQEPALLLLYNTKFQADAAKVLLNAICPYTLPRICCRVEGVHLCSSWLSITWPKVTWGVKGFFNLTLASIMKGSQDRNSRQEPRHMN